MRSAGDSALPPRDAPATRSLWLCATASVLALALATLAAPQGLHFYDPVMQLLALRHYETGLSPSWHVFARVDPLDLARDLPEFITWWPPSTQLLVLPLRELGLSFAASLRLIALAALLLGTWGWVHWFACFDLPRPWLVALALGLPWLRCASSALFRYSAEILALAITPWLLLGAAALLSSNRSRPLAPWLLFGFAVGASYLFKYSLGLVAFSVLGAACLWLLLHPSAPVRAPRNVARLAATIAAALLLPLLWHGWIRLHGSATPVGHAEAALFDRMGFAFLFANPALALADAFGPLFYLLVYPGWGPLATGSLNTLGWIGLPVGLILFALLGNALRDRRDHAPTWLAALTLVVTSLLVFALWFVADVSHEPRIIAPAALAALPLALAHGRRLALSSHRLARVTLGALAVVFIAVPFLWSPFYVAAKIRQSFRQAPGATGLAIPALQTADIPALLRELEPYAGPRTVWVVPDPELALELPGRAIYLKAGRSIAEDLRNSYDGRVTLAHWRTREPIDLAVLLPDTGSASVPAALVGNSIAAWERVPLASSALVLWRGRLDPAP